MFVCIVINVTESPWANGSMLGLDTGDPGSNLGEVENFPL